MMMIFGLPQKTIEEDIPYDDCGGTDGAQVASIQLTGCETDEICHITMEDILTLKVTWKTYQARITALMSKLEIAFFPGFKRQVPIVPLDACSYLNCPLYSNDDVHYVANFTVPNSREILAVSFPKLSQISELFRFNASITLWKRISVLHYRWSSHTGCFNEN
ncbi:hypothetical protein HHI36_013601 [Cryptolaemus montrouzieri]|uniref:MD-2-related lipid-recognition domain-containing protein n=1 Tax=Cryptolaemus montrouzieri TaxID=559131 RepID=A0ABD2NHQ1_9CUCU